MPHSRATLSAVRDRFVADGPRRAREGAEPNAVQDDDCIVPWNVRGPGISGLVSWLFAGWIRRIDQSSDDLRKLWARQC